MVGRAPQAEPTSVALGTASGGALDPKATRPPHVGPKPAFAGGPDLTINVVNSYGTPLSIFYGSNAGAPTPVGNPGSGVLTSSTRVLFPSSWAGRITIGRNYDPQGSKIEGSFSPPNYVPDVDISYVDGYSVPISCSCSGVAVAGCNIRMFFTSSSAFSSRMINTNPRHQNSSTTATPVAIKVRGRFATIRNRACPTDLLRPFSNPVPVQLTPTLTTTPQIATGSATLV